MLIFIWLFNAIYLAIVISYTCKNSRNSQQEGWISGAVSAPAAFSNAFANDSFAYCVYPGRYLRYSIDTTYYNIYHILTQFHQLQWFLPTEKPIVNQLWIQNDSFFLSFFISGVPWNNQRSRGELFHLRHRWRYEHMLPAGGNVSKLLTVDGIFQQQADRSQRLEYHMTGELL